MSGGDGENGETRRRSPDVGQNAVLAEQPFASATHFYFLPRCFPRCVKSYISISKSMDFDYFALYIEFTPILPLNLLRCRPLHGI